MRALKRRLARKAVYALRVKGPLALKDKFSMSLSVLALLVSFLTAYFNLVRQYDDVRIVINLDPQNTVLDRFTYPSGDILNHPRRLTFINSGNRSVAITSVRISVLFATDLEAATECTFAYGGEVSFYYYEFEPFTLKANDIAVPKMEPRYRNRSNIYGEKIEETEGTRRNLVSCLLIGFITPDNVVTEQSIVMTKLKKDSTAEIAVVSSTAIPLVKAYNFRFF
jgi:hypothetical protein